MKTLPVASPSQLGRPLPNSVEAEEYLHSIILLDGAPTVTKCIMAGITPGSFYDPKHAVLYEIELGLYAKQEPITIATVAEDLRVTKRLNEVGGWAWLTQVTSKVPTTAETNKFIRVVREQSLLRELIRSRSTTVEDCYNFAGNFDEFVSGVMEREGRAVTGTQQEEESIQQVAAALLDELGKPKNEREGVAGQVSWGLLDLDRICGKMDAGDLVILAGMPSSGKSVLSQQAAWLNAKSGSDTLVFSYEMTKRDISFRIAQQESRLNYGKYDDAPVDWKLRFNAAMRSVKESKTFHVFEKESSVQRIVARCRAVAQKKKIGLIVVDFLQYLARLEPNFGKERTDEKLGRVTATLKALGKEMGCPVLLLSSLNRDGYKDGGKPGLAALRNSGEIESDADVVMILWWPKTNPITGAEQDPHQDDQIVVEALQEKGRSKGVHSVNIQLTRSATRFDNCTR